MIVHSTPYGHITRDFFGNRDGVVGSKSGGFRWPIDVGYQGVRAVIADALNCVSGNNIASRPNFAETGKTAGCLLGQYGEKADREECKSNFLFLEQALENGDV